VEDLLYIMFALALLGWMLVPSTICWLKGKRFFAVSSALLGGSIWGLIGAVRVAKPGSWWARRYYGESSDLMRKARERFYA
jgi:hypothetical protein